MVEAGVGLGVLEERAVDVLPDEASGGGRRGGRHRSGGRERGARCEVVRCGADGGWEGYVRCVGGRAESSDRDILDGAALVGASLTIGVGDKNRPSCRFFVPAISRAFRSRSS